MAVCQAIQGGFQQAQPQIDTQVFPMADGGEGTAKILTYHAGGQWLTVEVAGPLSSTVSAGYGLSSDGTTAYIDMAEASGLQLVPQQLRNPLQTTSYGTGQLIEDAMKRGVQKILLGIGGSATNDGGIGMAKALGYRFLDRSGNELSGIGEDLSAIQSIDLPWQDFPEIEVLCDVNNPLFGENGAAAVYAPQKGAHAEMVKQLDRGLVHLAEIVVTTLGKNLANTPGAGAAGGMGYGAMVFLNARLRSGIEAVMDEAGFTEVLSEMDLVITGEGKIDEQTVQGKLISGICQRAKQFDIPVIALCGALLANPALVRQMGLQAAYSIQRHPISLAEALQQTQENLSALGFQLANTLVWDKKGHW